MLSIGKFIFCNNKKFDSVKICITSLEFNTHLSRLRVIALDINNDNNENVNMRAISASIRYLLSRQESSLPIKLIAHIMLE